MKCLIGILFFINLVFCIPNQKYRQSDDGSKYYIENELKRNWFEAWGECARRNMSFLAIDTYEKHKQIDYLLRRSFSSIPMLWISGHDLAVSSRYEWASTGQEFSFSNWASNNPADKDEHCVIMSSYEWYDYNCSSKQGFMCEEIPGIKKVNLEKQTLNNDLKNNLFYFNNGK